MEQNVANRHIHEHQLQVMTLRMHTVLIGIIKLGHSNEHPFSTTRLSRQISFGDDDDDVDDDER